MDKINNKRGGYRQNSGRKTNYVSMEVKLPKEHKEEIKSIYGRQFNEVFRNWIKKLIKNKTR